MNEQKIIQIWVILFVCISIAILVIVSFFIHNVVIVALLHFITGSIAISVLIDLLNNTLRDK